MTKSKILRAILDELYESLNGMLAYTISQNSSIEFELSVILAKYAQAVVHNKNLQREAQALLAADQDLSNEWN